MNTVTDKYRKFRAEHPLLPARYALGWAKSTNGKEDWEPDNYGEEYHQEIDNFIFKLKVSDHSQCPEDGDLGHYVGKAYTYTEDDYEWNGNYPRPAEELPLGLPYTSFASGAYSQDQHAFEYFIPDGVEEQYVYLRRMGQSKSVAWDMTKEWVEQCINDWFGGPLYYATVTVEAVYKTSDDTEIVMGYDSIGTSYLDSDDIFSCVKENGMIGNALDDAKARLDELKEVV